jgi:molybdenum cofactor cytidylyltransferase
VTGIVLAAGTSSRLGRPKQLLDLQGKPVLQHVLDATAASGLDRIVVVLGHQADRISARVHLPQNGRVVVNPRFEDGQSTSLRAGIEAAGTAEAIMVLLGDQPGVRPEAIRSLIEAWRGGSGPVVQASYGGRPAHPTLFDRSVWPRIMEARGDQGGRGILAAHPDWRVLVEVGGTPPADIDTEEDYQGVREAFGDRRPGVTGSRPIDP